MVKVHLKTSTRVVPIAEIISAGQNEFFKNLSENSTEFRGQNTDRFKLLYNGKPLKNEDLNNLTDDCSIRVVLTPENKIEKPITQEHRQSVDAEMKSMTAMFRNPEDRRLHGFNHDFSFPDHIQKLLKKYPQLVFENRLLCVLRDWYLFRAYYIRNEFKDDVIRREFKYQKPEVFPILKELIEEIASRYGIVRVAPGMPANPPITQALLQSALQAALAGVNAQAPAPAAAPQVPPAQRAPAPAPAPAPQEEPMQQGYEQQIAILREYGFENEELIQLALEQSNGDIQGAMEFLIELQN